MSVIRHILPVSSSVSCLLFDSVSTHVKKLHIWEYKCFALIVSLGGGGVVGGRVCNR
jgi:hypothetical protein